MNDPNLNTALKWAIENSAASEGATEGPKTQITPEALAALMGYAQKSDADLMKESMAVIVTDEVDIDDRLQAFDNFEQLIENLDNANNMEPLKLWTPLVAQLENEHPHMRAKAASVCSVAVQNNTRTQERLLLVGALPVLVRMATTDTEPKARKKAVSALSSAVRNFQAGLDDVLSHMPAEYKPESSLDANDMESVDVLINKLRESI